MEHGTSLPFLRALLLFLALAGILIPLLKRLRINPVLGFLVTGTLVGPFGIALWAERWPLLAALTIPRAQAVQSLAELGIVFLLFLIGLELSAERIWAMRRWMLAGGTAQVLVSAAVIGTLAWMFGNAPGVAVVLGLVLSLSSTAVVVPLLQERRALASPVGQASFAVLMLQDFAVVPLLILVELLGKRNTGNLPDLLGVALLKSALAIALILLVGRRLVGPLFRQFAGRAQPDVFMALTLLVTLSIAALTAAAGLSMALGAFLAGLLLAETEYRHEVEVTIEPFKGLLMGLFFMSVGMGIDVREVARDHLWILGSVLGLVGIKATVAATIFRIGGLPAGKALEGGLLLSQGGEFAFIVVGYAAATALLDSAVAQFMLLVVSLSLMLTPLLAQLGSALGERLDRATAPEPDDAFARMPDDLAGHIVIAGFGRVGQLLAEVFDREGVPYVAVEQDAHVVATLRRAGRPVYYGNAERADLMQRLRIAHAAGLVISMDQPAAVLHAVRAARRACPDLPIYARSRDERHALELRGIGATGVVPETLEAGLQLAAFALQARGIGEGRISATLEEERERRITGSS